LKKISHAYIFLGTDDETTGEALRLAQRANCENEYLAPCGFCNSCRKIQNNVHPDVAHIYPEGASIKIEQIRKLILDSAGKAVEGANKVFILHQAHTMTAQAQNALLKTLEDPIADSILIMLSNNLKQLIPTVISRCQVRDFSHEAKPLLPAETRQRIADILLGRLKSRELSEIGALARELSETDEKAEEMLEFIVSLYRDVLLAKTNSSLAFINQDMHATIEKFASALSVKATVSSLDLATKQLKAIRARANKNLVWYNLLLGLEEVV
jgi:DNA polymerase-3 subunit delta'